MDAYDEMLKARGRHPLEHPWGLFLAPKGKLEGLYWFSDRDQLHAFVAGDLWTALTGSLPPPDVAEELEGLLQDRPSLSWALLEQLNLVLEPVAQAHWWGTLAQLFDGEDPFAKDLREAFREDSGQGTQDFGRLSPAQQAAFAQFVENLWQD